MADDESRDDEPEDDESQEDEDACSTGGESTDPDDRAAFEQVFGEVQGAFIDDRAYVQAFYAHYAMTPVQMVGFLLGPARGICGDRRDAKALVHDFMVDKVLFRMFPDQALKHPRAWLRASIRRYWIDTVWRPDRRHPVVSTDAPGMERVVGGDGPLLTRESEWVVLRTWFWSSVARLDSRLRDVVELHLDHDSLDEIRSFLEIAAELGIDRGTVSRRFRAAMEHLRDDMEDDADGDGDGDGDEEGPRR